MSIDKSAKILVTGYPGMVAQAVVRGLARHGYQHILSTCRSSYDLTIQREANQLFLDYSPEYVINCAAKVGGIGANSAAPAEFGIVNTMIQANIIDCCHRHNVKKLVNMGSSCIYPKNARNPIHEWDLLSGYLEPTNSAYAIAKIAGVLLCQAYNEQHGTNFVSVMPTNLYGPGDTYHAERSHVIPAMILKFHNAMADGRDNVTLWGDGSPRREFLHVDDLADAVVTVLENDQKWVQHVPGEERERPLYHFNIGYGSDITIRELAHLVRKVVCNKHCDIIWDTSRPNGTPQKLISSWIVNQMGWFPKIELEDGLRRAYRDFLEKNGQLQAYQDILGRI